MNYSYDGICKVRCAKCGTEYEIDFFGDNTLSPEEAIDIALKDYGWEVDQMLCSNCYDGSESIFNENEEEDFWDDVNDYDEDWDEEENT